MTRSVTLVGGVVILVSTLSGAVSQTAPPTAPLMPVDSNSLANGYRTSQLVGNIVVNEFDEVVGTVEDLIVIPNGEQPFAVLSVGGFLGMLSAGGFLDMRPKYVVLSWAAFEVSDKGIILRSATKESLKSLPEFDYNN